MVIVLRVVEEHDLPLLVARFPEGAPVNRHVERFAGQQVGDVTCLAAWDGNVPIGHVFVSWLGGRCQRTDKAEELGCAEIGDLDVVELARGQGIGCRLMEAAEELVRNKGLNTVGLSVAARNPKQNAARELYKKLNYSEAGYGEYTVTYSYMDLDGNTHHDEDQYVYLVKSIESG